MDTRPKGISRDRTFVSSSAKQDLENSNSELASTPAAEHSSLAPADNANHDYEIEVVAVKRKQISPVALTVLAFFWISGGIYGNEEMMLMAEARHVLPLLVVMPLLYSFPIMLVTAELATSMPLEGGSVAWIQEACGRE